MILLLPGIVGRGLVLWLHTIIGTLCCVRVLGGLSDEHRVLIDGDVRPRYRVLGPWIWRSRHGHIRHVRR